MPQPVGKPRIYPTPDKLQSAIDDYFEHCEGEKYLDGDGQPVITNKGNYVYLREPKPPTVEGLAVFLGFAGLQSWYDYRDRKEYFEVYNRARLRFAQFNAESLYDRDRFKGSERTLVHHYDWEPANQIQITNNTLNIDMTEAEIDKRLSKLGYLQLTNSDEEK